MHSGRGKHGGGRGWSLWVALVAALSGLPASAADSAAVNDGEVTFGMSAPFSGPSKEYGRELKTGFELAFAAVNEAGGVAGRKLRLVAMDDGYEPARTQTAIRELLERYRVLGLVGVFGSANSAAVLPYVLDKQALYFAPYSGAPLLRNEPPDRYVFNYRPSYAEETAAVVKHLIEVRRIKPSQVAVFMQDDGFGQAGWNGVAHMMRKYRRDPAQVLRVTYKRNSVDVEEAVRTIRQNAGHIRAVVMVAVYRPAAKFIERLRSAGLSLVFTNVSAVDSTELSEELMSAGAGIAEGVIVTEIVPLPTSRATAILRYQEALQRYAPGERPDFVSLEGYIAANILVEGLKRAGRDLSTDRLVDALESIRGLDMGIGVPITFGPSEHQASHKVWGTVLDASGTYRTFDLD